MTTKQKHDAVELCDSAIRLLMTVAVFGAGLFIGACLAGGGL